MPKERMDCARFNSRLDHPLCTYCSRQICTLISLAYTVTREARACHVIVPKCEQCLTRMSRMGGHGTKKPETYLDNSPDFP